MQLTEMVDKFLSLHFTDVDRTRAKDNAVNEYEKFRDTLRGEVPFAALQKVEQLENQKILHGENWRKLGDEMFGLEQQIARVMEANNMKIITNAIYDKRPVNLVALPNYKLEVKQY